jgi:hypothetical protein
VSGPADIIYVFILSPHVVTQVSWGFFLHKCRQSDQTLLNRHFLLAVPFQTPYEITKSPFHCNCKPRLTEPQLTIGFSTRDAILITVSAALQVERVGN